MDFEAELAKFQPSLEIDQAEDAIYGNNTTDVTDLLQSILKDEKSACQILIIIRDYHRQRSGICQVPCHP